MLKKISKLAEKLFKGHHLVIDTDPEMKEIADKLEKAANIQIPAGIEERIRQLLKAEHSQMLATQSQSVNLKSVNENNMNSNSAPKFVNFFKKNRWAYGLVAVLAISVITLGAYPIIPAPKVQGYSVKNAVREIPYNAPFKIVFTQPMNRNSVETAFKVEPEVKGSFEWNFNTVLYRPEENLRIGEDYRVNISTYAKSLIGKNITQEYQEVFHIVEAPKVSFYTPSGSDQVDKDAKITVMFNQPLLKLTTLSDSEKLIPDIKIEPNVKGRWKWIGTSALQFLPEDLPLATDYKITVPKGIVAASEGTTDEEVIFIFSTKAPDLVNVFPDSLVFNNSTDVPDPSPAVKIDENLNNVQGQTYGPKQELTLSFNQKVDLGSFKSHFSLLVNRNVVNYEANYTDLKTYRENYGSFGIDKNQIQPETPQEKIAREKMIVVRAMQDFPFEAAVSYEIKEGIAGTEGPLVTGKNYNGGFYTASPLKIREFNNLRDYVSVFFNNPVKSEDLKRYARLISNGKEEEIAVDFGNPEEGSDHFIDFKGVPGQEFSLTITKGLKDSYGQILQDDYIQNFVVPDLDPTFEIRSNNFVNLLDNYLEPELYVKSANINNDLTFTLSQVDPASETKETLKISELGRWKQSLAGKKNEYLFTKLNLNEILRTKLNSGYYELKIEGPGDETKKMTELKRIILTKTALAAKQAEGKLLVWATDLESGEPVANMNISVHSYYNENSYNGSTDGNGLAEISIPSAMNSWDSLLIIGTKGDEFTMMNNDWRDGINPWNFNIANGIPQKEYAYLYTERPIYRPGDTVFFKGIFRTDNGRRFKLPEHKNIFVSVRDPLGNQIYNQKLAMSANGTFNGKLQVSQGGSVGNYNLIAYLNEENVYNNRFETNFSVAEYRRPDFKVSVNSEKPSYINGDEVSVNIKGEYFFGGNLAQAPVNISLLSEGYYFNEFTEEWYNFANYDLVCFWECPRGESSQLAAKQLLLDNNGEANFKYTPNIKGDEPSQIYTIEATVTDPGSEQAIANRVLLPIHKGEYYIGVRPGNYIYSPENDVKAQVISVDSEGKILSGKTINVQLKKRQWRSIRKQNIDGYYYYENDFKDELISEKSVSTGTNGRAEISFGKINDGGNYIFATSGKDNRGNIISASNSFYVTSEKYLSWGQDNNDRIELIPDKLDYNVGDTAKILIKSPYSNVKALITIEKGNILEKKIIDIKSNSQTIEVPILEDYLPNFYVSAVLVKGSGSTQSIQLKLSKAESEKKNLEERSATLIQQIDSNIGENLADKARGNTVQPVNLEEINNSLQEELRIIKKDLEILTGEIENMKIAREKVKNSSQNDDGIAAFKLGYAELRVETADKKMQIGLKTDKEKYLPGEMVTLEIETRKVDDSFIPAELSISVVDESVLSLKENVINDLIKYFYQERVLGVLTGHSLTKLLNRINVEVQSGLKGGGGGMTNNDTRTRSNFKDTAYWSGSVETGSDGKASISFRLPDNLTTWQILAIGSTKDTRLGSQKIKFKTTKDLLLTPVAPRFLTINDELEVGFTAHNNTDQTINANVSITAEGTQVQTESSQSASIRSGESVTKMWKIKVLPGKEARFIFKVEDTGPGGVRDEVDMKLPVHPFNLPEFVATSGSIQKNELTALETVFIPGGIDTTVGELKVSIAATFLGSIANGLEYLVSYPYGCAEQIASSLLPNLAVKQIIDLPQVDNNLINIKELDDKVFAGLQKLYGYQQPSGGFGIWQDSKVSTHLTAYILNTLYNAKKTGYSVDDAVMERAKNFILNNYYLGESPNSTAYAAFVLAEIGSPQESMMNNLYDQRDKLNLTAKTYLALAMSGSPALTGKTQNLTSYILTKQKLTTRGVSFDEENADYENYDSNAKLNAAVLRLLTRTLPDSPILDKMLFEIRYERTHAGWQNTHASSETLMALVEYLKKSGEFESEFFAKVIINGGDAMDTAFFKKENFGEIKKLTMPIEKLLTENKENQIQISRSGSGKVYYDLLFKYYLPLDRLEPRSEGFSISQNYYKVDDLEENKPLDYLPFGETIKAKIAVVVSEERHNVLVEDLLPAGIEVLDFSLSTTQSALNSSMNNPWENNTWFFNHSEVRDDRVAYFADNLPAGVYELEYFARVTAKGRFSDLPAHVEEMYQPEVFGRTTGRIMESR